MKKRISTLTSILLVLAMILALSACEPQTPTSVPTSNQSSSEATSEKSNLDLSLELDDKVKNLKAVDGQPLFFDDFVKTFPERPADPLALPETDPLHWYDYEYAGWSTEKVNYPESPADGCIGKKIIMVIHGEHPYYTAYASGAQMMAANYQMELKILWPNWDLNTQNQMIDQAINEKPDLIILLPLDVKAAVNQYKKINEAGIPVIAAHQLTDEEGLKYALCWTGPDEWAPRRVLSEMIAEELDSKGGYAIMSHNPGGSTYYSRGYGYVSTLSEIAPDMKLLDLQSPGFDAEKAKQLALDWIKKYGDELKCIIAADDGAQLIGIMEACDQTGRDDIVLVAAGNSKTGMDNVKTGRVLGINYESPSACAATAIRTAADYFNGKTIPSAVYLPAVIITPDNVDEFYPAQW